MKNFKLAIPANEIRHGALLCGGPCVIAFEAALSLDILEVIV